MIADFGIYMQFEISSEPLEETHVINRMRTSEKQKA